jgi:hypothetical protein
VKKATKAAVATQRPFSSSSSKGFDMPKIVKFPADFYDMGVVKYAADSYHPLNSETQSLVNSGYAELIDSGDNIDHVEVLTALAKIADDRATAARAIADELEAAAEQARALAKAAAEPKDPPAP